MAQGNRTFESTIRDIVYSVDTGIGLKIIRITLYILMLLTIVMLYTATQFKGLKTEESMDYAQLGRNLSLNGGMVTKCVRPLSMWKMSQLTEHENPQINGHPDLYHPPAYPAVLSAGFKLFKLIGLDPFLIPDGKQLFFMPAEQWVIIPVNHLFTILTGWIVFCLGKRLFSKEIGFLGMTIYYLSNIAWSDSISGLNISMAGFFLTASFHSMVVAMLNRRDRDSRISWVLPFICSVIFAAIAFLTRYITIAAIPGIVLFAWLMCGGFRGGKRYVFIFLALYLILVSPWLYRNFKISGNPMGLTGHTSLTDTSRYPGNALDRDLHPTFSFKRAKRQIEEKWVINYSENYRTVIPGLGGGVLMAFFITTFFYKFVRPQVNYFGWGLGFSILFTICIAGFFSDSSINMINIFWPFIILYGLGFFYILIDRIDVTRLYTLWLKYLVVLLSAIPFLLTLMPPHAGRPYPPYWPPIIREVSSMLSPREVICSDMPWATAWYGDRISILLPKDVESFYEINDLKQHISGMYVTAITKNKSFAKDLLVGSEKSWFPVISGRTPPDFPLKYGISLNARSQDQIFLSDRDRWSAKNELAE